MKSLIGLALVGALSSGAAQANVGYTSVTGTAGVTSAAFAGDGNFPPIGQWYTIDTAYWQGAAESVLYTFDNAYQITGLTISVDHNDFYRVELSTDGVSWVDYHTVLSFEGGNNGSGMDTFMPAKAATQTFYSFARVTGLGGDGLYSVGELQLNGVAAVPEPETLALMLGGLGLLGLRLRRRNG